AARVAALQAQCASLRALHAQVLDEPVPRRLRQALRRPPLQWHWPHALAAGGMLSLGLGLGYGLGSRAPGAWPQAAQAQLPVFVREAAAAHAVYVPEQRHPVEVAAQQQAHLVQWLSKRLGVQLKVPVLEAQGFHLVGGRLLPGEAGQARAQFMYQDPAGERVTLYVSVLSREDGAAAAPPVAFHWTGDESAQGFYWIDGRRGYAVSAALPRERLYALAEAIYRQLDSTRGTPHPEAPATPRQRASPRAGSGVAPDRAGGRDRQPRLGALVLDGHIVAMDRAGEAAVRRQGELLEGGVLRRLVDAALEVVLGFQGAELGRDQAQHHDLAARQEAQGPEIAAAVIVVFHEIRIQMHFRQQRLGHGLVVALGRVGALEIAAAQVHGQHH